MNSDSERIHLAVSVGGSKCAFGAVGLGSGAILARSRRVEWTERCIKTFPEFAVMIANEFRRLLADNVLDGDRVVGVGVAWPGPQVDGTCYATFLPGTDKPQPVASLLQKAMGRVIDARFGSLPVSVMLDAVARAVGEASTYGALHFPPQSLCNAGMLVNIATGIAGGIVQRGRPLLACNRFGPNYGQFGRFLLLNTRTRQWVWRPTTDGSVAPHSSKEVRWTLRCAGPALAQRIGLWCSERQPSFSSASGRVVEALCHYHNEGAVRSAFHEMILLRWVTEEAARDPGGHLAQFLANVASEVGGALRVLLGVFEDYGIGRVVLAGGVGENLGSSPLPGEDPFLDQARLALTPATCELRRALLGVDAEFLGLAACSEALL